MTMNIPTLSVTRAPPPSLAFSSSHSNFFNNKNNLSFRFKTQNFSVVSSRPIRKKKGLTCNALFGLGVPELAVIAGVAAILFGPKKLPEVGRSIGKTVKSFQQAAKEFETELKKEPESPMEYDESTALSEQEKKQDSQKENV